MSLITICFDESGNMGFDLSKSGTKNHVLITFLIMKECRPIVSLVKKVFLTLPKIIKRKRGAELHAHHEKPVTIKRLLTGLSLIDNVRIATMRLDKRKIVLIGNPNELYSNMVVTLINRLYADNIIRNTENVLFVASRRNTSKRLNDEFCETIVNSTKDINFEITIKKPSDDKCLQAVDFVSWAFWQKYENGDNTYTDIIANKVVNEYVMYER